MKTPIRKLIFLIVSVEIILSISIYGCAGVWWPEHRDLYENLASNKIRTIAILPIRNNNLDSNEAKEVNRYFMTGITKILKNYILISPEESLEILNRDSLTERYYNKLPTYFSSITINKKLIKDVGESLGCDAIVQGEISKITKSTYLDQNKAETSCWVNYGLISTKNGKDIWGNLVTSTLNADLTSGPPSLINVVKAGIDSLFLYTHQ